MTEQMYEKLHRMIEARVRYWNEADEWDMACAYKSALDMLEYAHDDRDDLLSEFDYYD